MCASTHAARAGHINFNDEVSAAMRLADGVLLVVDAAEGVMLVTDKVVKQALAEGLPIALLITKVRQLPFLCCAVFSTCTGLWMEAIDVSC